MALISITSPHSQAPGNIGAFMRQVIYATIPGVAALTYYFGWGTLINIAFAIVIALCSEALILWLRKKPILFYLSDYSAVVTAILLAIALPPTAPWWLTLVGTSFAIIIAKQLYGGMGYNPFNPAMIGYALMLVSYPLEMTSWLPALGVEGGRQGELDFSTALSTIFASHINGEGIDAFTMATPLDSLKTAARSALTFGEAVNNPVFGEFYGLAIGKGWAAVNLGFLVGGLYLLARKIITWHIPAGFLASLFLFAIVSHWFKDAYGPASFHLLSGGTMLGAFFIATDPVSAATSNMGRIIYGFGIGTLIYIIRVWGGYPDAVAFAVLLMNLCAPTIDYYIQPRTYGHGRRHQKGGR